MSPAKPESVSNSETVETIEQLRAAMLQEVGDVFDALVADVRRGVYSIDSTEWKVICAIKRAIVKGGAK